MYRRPWTLDALNSSLYCITYSPWSYRETEIVEMLFFMKAVTVMKYTEIHG